MLPFESLGTISYWDSIVTVALVLYHFREKMRHWSKIVILFIQPPFDAPVRHIVWLWKNRMVWPDGVTSSKI